MGEHKLDRMNGSSGQPAESFVLNDAAMGKTTPIRDCTNEQIQRALNDGLAQRAQLAQQLNNMLDQIVTIERGIGAFAYEMDRRSRNLIVAPH